MKRQFKIMALAAVFALFISACGGGGGGDSGGGNSGSDSVPDRGSNAGGGTTGIGTGGGIVTSSDNKVTVTVPVDAVLQTMNITVAVASNTPAGNVGAAYDLGPDGYTFNKPLTFSITYDDSVFPIGTNESNFRLGTVVNNAWVGSTRSKC